MIDLLCYTRNQANTGDDHDPARACGLACVKWEGQPVGLVTADGKVYQVSQKDGMTMISAGALKMVSK